MVLNCGLEKTIESPLDCREIQPVYSKGDQSSVFIGRTDAKAETPILWPLHVITEFEEVFSVQFSSLSHV